MPYGNKKNSLNGSERFDNLVHFIEFGDDVKDEVKKYAVNLKELHPYMTVAKKEGIPCKYYVCAYDCLYSFETFVDCLDKLFKTFFVFNSRYPNSLNAIFLFLQHFVYRIYLEKKDKYESATTVFINSLDATRLPSHNKK